MAQLVSPYYYIPYNGEVVYTNQGNKSKFYDDSEGGKKWICVEGDDPGNFNFRNQNLSITKPEEKTVSGGINVKGMKNKKMHVYVTGIHSFTVYSKVVSTTATLNIEVYKKESSTPEKNMVKNGVQNDEIDVTISDLNSKDYYDIVIKGDSSNDIPIVALQFYCEVQPFSCDLAGATGLTSGAKDLTLVSSTPLLTRGTVTATLNYTKNKNRPKEESKTEEKIGTISDDGTEITFPISLSYNASYKFTLDANKMTTEEGGKNAKYEIKFSTRLENNRFATPSDENAAVVIKTVDKTKANNAEIYGTGIKNFQTIQAAIDDVEVGKRGIIYIRDGEYNENINSPASKFISFVGEDMGNTVLTSSKHRGNKVGEVDPDYEDDKQVVNGKKAFERCAALNVYNDRFYAENLTIRNTSEAGGQAEALYTKGDAHIFNNCLISGYQDTYKSNARSRGYFTGCKIVGRTDFIWANGVEWFEDCEIMCRNTSGGYITAPEDTELRMSKKGFEQLSVDMFYAGFFFNNCNLTAEDGTGAGCYTLGRPIANYSGSVFMNSTFGNHISAAGWTENGGIGGNNMCTFMEYNNKDINGNPINITNRVSWSHQLSEDEYNAYFKPEYILGLPLQMLPDGVIEPERFEFKTILKGSPVPSNFVINKTGTETTVTWPTKGAKAFIVYKDGVFDRILTTPSFTCSTDDAHTYTVKSISRHGVTSEAVTLPLDNVLFEYTLTATTNPGAPIRYTQERTEITMEWENDIVRTNDNDSKPYMKSAREKVITLTGEFKAGDLITLNVWNCDVDPAVKGFTISEQEKKKNEEGYNTIKTTTDVGEIKEKGTTYTVAYVVQNDCDQITINRYSIEYKTLYINRILITRNDVLRTISDMMYMDVEYNRLELSASESGSIVGPYLPSVRGVVSSDESIYNGTPTFNIKNTDLAEISYPGNNPANWKNARIIPKATGTTKLIATYENSGYTVVVPCEIDLNIVGSCIREITATKTDGTGTTFTVFPNAEGYIDTTRPDIFEVNGNLQCNIFHKGYKLDVKFTNPYREGDVRFRYHVHDDPSSGIIDYRDEVKFTITHDNMVDNPNKVEQLEVKNSFVIHAEHIIDGNIVDTKTYEFIYVDDLVYYVAQANHEPDFEFTANKTKHDTLTGLPSTMRESQLSVRGLKMTFGGKNETWAYKAIDGLTKAYTGRDGVLTREGYQLSVPENGPAMEDSQNYEHRFATRGYDFNFRSVNYTSSISNGTFSLPVKGANLKFEPEQNGTIILHLFQTGCTYSVTDPETNILYKGVGLRPLYFLDEAGLSVPLKSYMTTSRINFDEYNEDIVYREDMGYDDNEEHVRRMLNKYMVDNGYATLSEIRPTIKGMREVTYTENNVEKTASMGDGEVVATEEGKSKPQELIVLHSETGESGLPEYIYKRHGEYKGDLVKFIDDSFGSSFTDPVTKDKTGYMLVTGGFIKYAFDVKAGKTYYLMQRDAKIGFCGYEFIPNQLVEQVEDIADEEGDKNSTFRCNNIKAKCSGDLSWRNITLSDADNADNITTLTNAMNYAKSYAEGRNEEALYQFNVTLNRNFTKERWVPIVLPFSVSQTRVQELFGDGTEVLHFYKITKNSDKTTFTLHLKKHYYDMIVAGTPVFIRPTKDITSPLVFNNVTLEFKDNTGLDVMRSKESDAMEGTIISSFNAGTIKHMGLYISDNKFYQNRQENGGTIPIKALRGWISTSGVVSSNAKAVNYLGEDYDFESEALDIDFVEIDDGYSTKTLSNGNIYNINGQMVGSTLTDINTLPNGIYIVNGKKFIVNNK